LTIYVCRENPASTAEADGKSNTVELNVKTFGDEWTLSLSASAEKAQLFTSDEQQSKTNQVRPKEEQSHGQCIAG